MMVSRVKHLVGFWVFMFLYDLINKLSTRYKTFHNVSRRLDLLFSDFVLDGSCNLQWSSD